MQIYIGKADGRVGHTIWARESPWVVLEFDAGDARKAAAELLRLADEVETLDCDKRRAHSHEKSEL